MINLNTDSCSSESSPLWGASLAALSFRTPSGSLPPSASGLGDYSSFRLWHSAFSDGQSLEENRKPAVFRGELDIQITKATLAPGHGWNYLNKNELVRPLENTIPNSFHDNLL